MRLAAILFIFIAHISFGQQPTNMPANISWGQEYTAPKHSILTKIITQDKEGYYVLRRQNSGFFSKSEKIFIERYDHNQKLQRSERIDLKYKKKVRQFEDVIVLGGELYMLSSFLNKGKKINYLFAERITRTLRASGKLTKIGEIPLRSIDRGGFFDYHISKDSSKILVYNELPYDRGNPEAFAFHVFDNQFKEIWNKDIIMPYNDEQFGVEEYQIDNEGNVHLLGIIYDDRSNRLRRRGKPTYRYNVITYTNQGETINEYPISLDDYFITDFTFRVANDGDLVCSGFYSEKGTTSIKGTYFFRLNSDTKTVYNSNIKAFDFDFLTEGLSDRRKAKAMRAEREGDTKREVELFQYSLDELVIRSDGGALLIAEQYYVVERDFNNNVGVGAFGMYQPVRQVDFMYNYHDIIIININPTGEIDWATKIPKQQISYNDGGYYSSYSHAIVRDKIYFVYNDNRRNFEGEGDFLHSFNNERQSVIALTEVRQDGSTHTYPLFLNCDANVITRPKVCKQTGRKAMTIYGERGRYFRFANLAFQ